MEKNWGLSLCGRTEIPEERQEVATGEGISLVTVGSEKYRLQLWNGTDLNLYNKLPILQRQT